MKKITHSLYNRLNPINQRRVSLFLANKRGAWSLYIFCIVFGLSLFAEFIANDRPILVSFDGSLLSPVLVNYPETRFGGDFETTADYRAPFVQDLINETITALTPGLSR